MLHDNRIAIISQLQDSMSGIPALAAMLVFRALVLVLGNDLSLLDACSIEKHTTNRCKPFSSWFNFHPSPNCLRR